MADPVAKPVDRPLHNQTFTLLLLPDLATGYPLAGAWTCLAGALELLEALSSFGEVLG
jgi:hypothetical protein